MIYKRRKINFIRKAWVYYAIIVIIINGAIYHYLLNLQESRNNTLLSSYQLSIKNLLEKDLTIIAKKSFDKRELFILQNVIKKLNSSSLTYMQDTSNLIFIDGVNNSWLLDIQELKEFLDKLLPSFFNYSIWYEGNIIAVNKDGYINTVNQKEYSIGDKLSINITLSKQSEYFLHSIEYINMVLLISNILTISFFILVHLIYEKRKSKINNLINKLKNLCKREKSSNKQLLLKEHIKQQINVFFIKQATQMLIQNGLKDIFIGNEEKNILQDIVGKDFIFPISLRGENISKVNVKKLSKNLNSYFYVTKLSSKLNISNYTKEEIIVSCNIEVYYQILISLIFNLMRFMDDQSQTQKILKMEIYEHQVRLIYRGYPLNKENMINLSNSLLSQDIDIFLLTCKKAFKSLQYHNIDYQILSNTDETIIEILNHNFNIKSKNENTTVIKFKNKISL